MLTCWRGLTKVTEALNASWFGSVCHCHLGCLIRWFNVTFTVCSSICSWSQFGQWQHPQHHWHSLAHPYKAWLPCNSDMQIRFYVKGLGVEGDLVQYALRASQTSPPKEDTMNANQEAWSWMKPMNTWPSSWYTCHMFITSSQQVHDSHIRSCQETDMQVLVVLYATVCPQIADKRPPFSKYKPCVQMSLHSIDNLQTVKLGLVM